MPDSRLTVRTLGLAMVALVLACVHAARGDGRSGVSTFTSGSAARGAGTRGSAVGTTKGDPFKPDAKQVASSGGVPRPQQSQAARNAAIRLRHDRAKAKTAGGVGRIEPVCIVRRAGDPMPLVPVPEPTPPAAAAVAAPAPALPPTPGKQPLKRNAFALSPTMAQSGR